MSEPDVFDPGEVAAADALDRQIDAVLAGQAQPDTDATVLWLHAAVRSDPPAGLAARVERERESVLRRRWQPFRWLAALLAYLFISQGVGNLVFGDWVSDGIGEAFSPHANREAAFAMVCVGIAVAGGALYRRFAPVAAATGVPLGIGFGIGGISEIGVFAPGAALHLTQGVLAIAVGVAFWRYWRDTSRGRDEEGA